LPAGIQCKGQREIDPLGVVVGLEVELYLKIHDRVVREKRDALYEMGGSWCCEGALQRHAVRGQLNRGLDNPVRAFAKGRPVSPARRVVLLPVEISPVVRSSTAVIEGVGTLTDE
jgi:hypothetical protein